MFATKISRRLKSTYQKVVVQYPNAGAAVKSTYTQEPWGGQRRPAEPRILVTGANGQVGLELVPYLRERYGAERVIATDVRSPSSIIADNGPFQYLDVLEPTQLTRLIVEENVGTVIHLAAILSAAGEKHPELALKINNGGTQNILEIARNCNNNMTVFCPSTIAVFGPSTPRVNTPVDCTMRPTTMYGLTKVYAELLGEYYHSKYGVNFRSLRYPGVVSGSAMPGGGTTDWAVEIYHEALRSGKYTCFVKEDTQMPMMYMSDLLKGTVDIIEAPEVTLTRRVYNLASMSFTPDDLATSIRRRIPNFELICQPDFRQKIADSWPQSVDDSVSRQDWGWNPEYDIDMMTDSVLAHLVENCEEFSSYKLT